jgi:predicted Zn finger-like uncharacterized protein
MIIECENCHTKFNLDESRLSKAGSKVRCSRCSHQFTAYPPEVDLGIEETPVEVSEEREPSPAEDEAVPAEEGAESSPEEAAQEEEQITDFDKTLIQEFDEEIEPISIEDLPIFDEDEELEMEKSDTAEMRQATAAAREVEKRAAAAAREAEKRAAARDEKQREFVLREPSVPVRAAPPVKKKRRAGLRITFLLIVLIIIGAGAAYIYRPAFLTDYMHYIPFLKKAAPKKEAFDMGNKRLSFKDLSGSFVNSSKAGRLFVVKGWVTNEYPDRRSFIRIKSSILDSKRTPVLSKVVFAGHPLTDKELGTLSIEEINNRLRDKLGKNKMNTNVLPNSSIPFVVVFDSLPEDMSEFTVEAVSSSPAGK